MSGRVASTTTFPCVLGQENGVWEPHLFSLLLAVSDFVSTFPRPYAGVLAGLVHVLLKFQESSLLL